MSEPKTPGEFRRALAYVAPECVREVIAERDEQIRQQERARVREVLRLFFCVGREGGRRDGRPIYSRTGERLAAKLGIDLGGADV